MSSVICFKQVACETDNSIIALELQNISIYPSLYEVVVSEDTVLYWSNINFQPIGIQGQRVWNFQGSGQINGFVLS